LAVLQETGAVNNDRTWAQWNISSDLYEKLCCVPLSNLAYWKGVQHFEPRE